MPILAYHLTWTTYGTWLPGDERGWKKKKTPGIQPPDDQRQHFASLNLAEEPVTLSLPQRAIVEQTIRNHCTVRQWTIHALNARSNHVHVVLAADRDADEVMKQLKAWCSRKLSDDAGLHEQLAIRAGRRHWFTEGGDKHLIDNQDYLDNAIRYVQEGQDTARSASKGTQESDTPQDPPLLALRAIATTVPPAKIRVTLPFHLRTLANVPGEVKLDVPPPVTQASILDAIESRYPMLRGTIRDHTTLERRPFLRFFVCNEDASHDPPDAPLPDAIAAGAEPFMIVGAISGG